MFRRLLPVIGLLIWAPATYGVLQLQSIEADITHDVCGIWGCYPPLQALIAWHGFLMMLTLPVLAYLIHALSRRRLRRVGWTLLGLAVLGLVLLTMQQLSTWYPQVSQADRAYLPQRVIYVATQWDVPLVQIILAGVICHAAALCKRPTAQRVESDRGL